MAIKAFNRKRNYSGAAKKLHIGEIRKSQLLTTFGIGNIVDFVSDTAIIGGADDWDSVDIEDRKLVNESLRLLTGAEYFLEPPISSGNKYKSESQNVRAYLFPSKLHCPVCKKIIDSREMINKSNRHQCGLINQKNEPCKGTPVASRFVLVCEKGHIDDFPYSWWVHNGSPCSCGKPSPRIEMFNINNRSDAESLMLKCLDCGKTRSMYTAFNKEAFGNMKCSGRHPHLGDFHEGCDCIPVTKLRSSTTIYYPVNYSALIIPPWSQKAVQLIEKKYTELAFMPEECRIQYLAQQIMPKAPGIQISDLIRAFELVKNQRAGIQSLSNADIYYDEYKVLCQGDVNEERYCAHSVKSPREFENLFSQITVIDRLIVTCVLAGFTRLTAEHFGSQERIAPLTKEKKEWLPGVELNGEGIFIRFNDSAIEQWIKRIGNRYDELTKAHDDSYLKSEKYSAKYVMLHTFAHLFIRQAANECGYSAASMKERIYSDFTGNDHSESMSGVLIYLSSPDSDGSLGGLANIADDTQLFSKVLMNMIHEARWCSSDPLCVSAKHQGVNSLNYAACHACTLLPETSCEFMNLLLDRVSIVGSTEEPSLGIMGSIG